MNKDTTHPLPAASDEGLIESPTMAQIDDGELERIVGGTGVTEPAEPTLSVPHS
jgi:hypothetical protein